MTDPDAEPKKTAAAPAGAGWRVAAALLILAAPLGLWAFGGASALSFERFLEARAGLEGWIAAQGGRAVVVFILAYAAIVALSIPGATIGTLAAGLFFGPFAGALIAAVAATIGAAGVFILARTAFGEALARRAGPFLQRLRAGFARDAAAYMLFLRLTPAFPFWAVNLAPALLGVPLKTFLWTTLVGVLPASFAFASAGAGLDSLLHKQAEAIAACKASGAADCGATLTVSALATRETLIALAALGLLALAPVLARRLRGRGEASQ